MKRLLVTLGCSFTYGTGIKPTKLKDEKVWGKLLAEQHGADFINFGIPNGSNNCTYQKFYDYVLGESKFEQYDEKMVILLLTSSYRESFYTTKISKENPTGRELVTRIYTPGRKTGDEFKHSNDVGKHLLMDDFFTTENCHDRSAMVVMDTKRLCDLHGFKFIVFSAFTDITEYNVSYYYDHVKELLDTQIETGYTSMAQCLYKLETGRDRYRVPSDTIGSARVYSRFNKYFEGFHPNIDGYAEIAKMMEPIVRRYWKNE